MEGLIRTLNLMINIQDFIVNENLMYIIFFTYLYTLLNWSVATDEK